MAEEGCGVEGREGRDGRGGWNEEEGEVCGGNRDNIGGCLVLEARRVERKGSARGRAWMSMSQSVERREWISGG